MTSDTGKQLTLETRSTLCLDLSQCVQAQVSVDYTESVEEAYRKLDGVLEELYEDLGFQSGI